VDLNVAGVCEALLFEESTVDVCFSVCAADCDEAIVLCNTINTELVTS